LPDQLSIPPRVLSNGLLATVEQGSDAEIAQRVNILCRTPPAWLDGRPDFGLQDDLFRSSGADLVEISRQIRGLGPDIEARIVEDASLMDQGLDSLDLQVGTVTR
jgi:hypothetical protein